MKIVIEARSLSAQGGGVKNYTQQLIKGIKKQDSTCNVTIVHDMNEKMNDINDVEEIALSRKGDLALFRWLGKQLPEVIEKIKPDVIHFTKADVFHRYKYPTVVTIYDIIPLIFPSSQTILRRFYWPKALKRAVNNSDHVITISEASKKDLIKKFNIAENRVTVTPLAIDHNHFKFMNNATSFVSGEYGIKKPYILFVGTLESRKNIPLLLRSFAKIKDDVQHVLVIVGKRAKGYKKIHTLIKELKLVDRVKLLDFVDYKSLPYLYSAAELFVWPSVYEGWGFPPQEAMACGTPVIVSNGGALPEVVGEVGEIVEFSTDNISKRTRDIIFENKLSSKMIEVLGREISKEELIDQARKHSWSDVAEKTLEVYTKISNNR